jgi:hypothetical protein
MRATRVLLALVPLLAGCAASTPPAPSSSVPDDATCSAAVITHDLGVYIEDSDATKAHLKTSYMARAGMSPSEIDAQVAKSPTTQVRITASSVDFADRHCCVARVLTDSDAALAFDAACGPKSEYRYTFTKRRDGKLLFVSDSEPGKPSAPDAPGLEAIRYEELVLAKRAE